MEDNKITEQKEIMENEKITDLLIKVTGVNFPNLDGSSRQKILEELYKSGGNFIISLVREPQNEYDKNAIMVLAGDRQVGYVGREESELLAPLMDANTFFETEVWELGEYKGTYYLHILIHEV